MTIRSDDQFNTTVYTLDDRFRGVFGTRRVLLMNTADIARLGFEVGDHVTVFAVARDQDTIRRSVEGMRVTSYDIPRGCAAGYYPECNPLIPLWHHAEGSFVPAAHAELAPSGPNFRVAKSESQLNTRHSPRGERSARLYNANKFNALFSKRHLRQSVYAQVKL